MTRKKDFFRSAAAAPHIVWMVLFIVAPLLFVIYYAFTDSEGKFTFDNITSLADYSETFLLSVCFAIIATVVCLLVAYPLAYAISRTGARTQRALLMLAMLPMWMNLLIRTYSMLAILDDGGFVNRLITSLGLPEIHFIGTPGAVIFGMVYNFFPYMLLPHLHLHVKNGCPPYRSGAGSRLQQPRCAPQRDIPSLRLRRSLRSHDGICSVDQHLLHLAKARRRHVRPHR